MLGLPVATMSAVDHAVPAISSSRKGFWSSSNISTTMAAVTMSTNDGRLQATKASFRRLRFFRRSKGGRQSAIDQRLTTGTDRDSRHITISNPIPLVDTASRSLQNGDIHDDLPADISPVRLSNDDIEQLSNAPHTVASTWAPLPLFKAYSRSIKYSTLPAPILPAEVILRQRHSPKSPWISTESNDDDPYLSKKAKRRSFRSFDALDKAGWTRKIYLLDTEGHMLQYGIEGPYDRLPEKILKFGASTAAFASDAIPGKHWVILLRERDDDESDKEASDPKKHFLSRLGYEHKREEAKSILMVLGGPDDMQSWLTALRREIERHGGPTYTSEDALPKRSSTVPPREPEDDMSGLRDDRVSDGETLLPSRAASSKRSSSTFADATTLNRRSLHLRPSLDASPLTGMGTSSEIEGLRERHRLSYASVGSRSTDSPLASRCQSPALIQPEESQEAPRLACDDRPASSREAAAAESRENNAVPTMTPRIPPPNFSVPVFSRRYSSQPSRHSVITRSASSSSQDQLRTPPETMRQRPVRQRAASTSVAGLEPDATRARRLTAPYANQGMHRPSLDSSDGRNVTADLQVPMRSGNRKTSAPELHQTQGHKLYSKPPPHIPETLDEDPTQRSSPASLEASPNHSPPRNLRLVTPATARAKRSSWGSAVGVHERGESAPATRMGQSACLSPRTSSLAYKRASWGSPEVPRIDLQASDPQSQSPLASRANRSSWGYGTGTGGVLTSVTPAALQRPSSRLSTHTASPPSSQGPGATGLPAQRASTPQPGGDGPERRHLASSIPRCKSAQFVNLGPPPAPPPDMPLPELPPALAASPMLPPPMGPLPATPQSETERSSLQASASRAVSFHPPNRRNTRLSASRSSLSVAELVRQQQTLACEGTAMVPPILHLRKTSDGMPDDVQAKEATMMNAF
ncbi:hypothetical protein KEM52_001892 [Ascosphaera acerosa]|nr:hypothetical protein KEM52_001892 [Ascosphaera acerosa]